MRRKSNKSMFFLKDDSKSYIYVMDGEQHVGTLMWSYQARKWIYKENKNGQ